MARATIGGWTSGNSSVSSCSSAAMPNTTSASMATTVMTGRLIARSEMNMLLRRPERHGGAWGDALRRAKQDDVSFVDARQDLDAFSASVSQSERDRDFFCLAGSDAHHPG